jgi:hypothetical protein
LRMSPPQTIGCIHEYSTKNSRGTAEDKAIWECDSRLAGMAP